MAGRKPGPRAKPPALKLIEGNPGKRPIPEPTELPPLAPAKPNWIQIFPAPPALPKTATPEDRADRAQVNADLKLARIDADWAWDQVVPVLDNFSLLATVDVFILIDFCTVWARIRQGERDITFRGGVQDERRDRGRAKNPWTTILNQYRTQFRALVAELGLTPSSRGTGDIFPVAPTGPAPKSSAGDLLD